MVTPLIDLSKLVNYQLVFADAAKACGFSSPGDINRFLFKSYGKALRDIPPANRPKGAIFFLSPPAAFGALAQIAELKPVLMDIRTNVACKFYAVPLDLSGGATVVHEPTSEEQREMAADFWTPGYAMKLSRDHRCCVVWAHGVGANVYLDGYCYIETPDVIEELKTGFPGNFQALSWDDGQIVFEFAQHKLNDTSPAGIWRIPEKSLLRPKPEKLMSTALGEFLHFRMAGYKHHDDEPYVENQGRADISLHSYNGFVYIIEVKWVGCSLKATKEMESKQAIEVELKKNTTTWLTEYGHEVFESGAKQLAQYFSTGKYQRAYLAVFDCMARPNARVNESLPIDKTHVAPHSPSDFRALRACVDPRKASVVSKAKNP
jgi:hypothetical protein